MLAHELDIRIATGENEYPKFAFLELLKRNAVDVVQPDNRRAATTNGWHGIGVEGGLLRAPAVSWNGQLIRGNPD